ncbi:MAG: acyl-ACP--UDP-N-acetylglucosamine O-acyltransferase [Prevotellaceae bacterium]|nr:acyl-ACP--UDP-N-acetylglucosamine O-acyltransferase [Prevotellaceae bacterium]
MSNISDKAVVSPKARIGQNVTIYPFVYIEDDVVIGDDCIIFPGANLMNGTRMGNGNKIFQNTVISAIPQDFNYNGGHTLCVIGDNNVIRENVVIARATYEDGQTVIGNDNFIMEGVHISHDTKIGNKNVLGYGTKIAGDCEIGNHAIFSSGVIANPGVRIGDAAMIQSGCRFSKDVPPYIVAGGHPIKYGGINAFVIDRIDITPKVKGHIANAYRLVFHGQDALINVCAQIEQQIPKGSEVDNIVSFLRNSKIGVISKMEGAE